MSIANRKPSSRYGQPVPPAIKYASLPASVGGVNALDSMMMMPPQDCIYTFNLMPVEYGLRLRRGYREWAQGLDGDVRTIIAYDSASEDPSKDKLWAVTPAGIYDITISTGAVVYEMIAEDDDEIVSEDDDELITEGATPPELIVAFSDMADPSGYGVFTEWTNDASEHFLFYADAANGVYQYTEADDWARPDNWEYDIGAGTVEIPYEDVVFVMTHKLRLWIIFKDSDDAWYSPVASATGGLFTKFTFGAKMPHGGYLTGLWSWTLDGGAGIDDYLVGVSRGGDVLIYRGADPEAADWAGVGSWFIGATPNSRRIVVDHGSDMYILSTYGVTSLRDLLQGSVANNNRESPSAKVNRFLRADVESSLDLYGWQMTEYPGDGFLQIITPKPSSTSYIQYNQTTSTEAWGFWRGVPALCGETWNGQYFMGGENTVYIYDGAVDGSTLDGAVGEAIPFQTLTSFQAPEGNFSTFKRCAMIRVNGVLAGTASISVKPVFDYNIDAQLPNPLPPPTTGESVWDSAIWDQSVWDYGLTGRSYPVGVAGMGRVMAIGFTGSAANRINVIGWDVMYTEGGLL